MVYEDLKHARPNHYTGWWLTPVQDRSRSAASRLLSATHPIVTQSKHYHFGTISDPGYDESHPRWKFTAVTRLMSNDSYHKKEVGESYQRRVEKKRIYNRYSGTSLFSSLGSFQSTCYWLSIRCWICNREKKESYEPPKRILIHYSSSETAQLSKPSRTNIKLRRKLWRTRCRTQKITVQPMTASEWRRKKLWYQTVKADITIAAVCTKHSLLWTIAKI